MSEVAIIGIDPAKRVFQLHGARQGGSVVFRKRRSRGQLLAFVAGQPRCVVAQEACATAHGWGRAQLQHPEPLPEDAGREHPASGLARPVAPLDRQHRDQGRGRRRGERAQAWRSQVPGPAHGPPRDRRGNTGSSGRGRHLQRCGRRPDAARVAQPDPLLISRSPASLPTAPTIRANVTMPLPNRVPNPSFRRAGMPNPGRPPRRMLWPATRRCGRRNAPVVPLSAASCGSACRAADGAATIAGAASKPRCLREPKARDANLSGQRRMARAFNRQVAEFQIRDTVLKGFTAPGIPVTQVAG